MPEFLSATMLPGRGMEVLQITAYLPGKGEVSLLASPSLEDATASMTGVDDDVNGEASLSAGGAFEVPWANHITGAVLPGAMTVLSNWHGRGLTLPVNWMKGDRAGAQSSMGGLLLKRQANSVLATPPNTPDTAEATFDAGNFDGHWPSRTEVKTTVVLHARTVDLMVTTRNIGTEPEPMGIGWRPHFAIPSGDRSQVTLRLPSGTRAELQAGKGSLPTGRLLTANAPPEPSHDGMMLRDVDLDESYVHLKSGTLSSGPEVELRDPKADYGLRLTAVSSTIKALHVSAPANSPYVLLDPQTNYDDPFGREWAKDEDTGLVVLQPGESMQWKVRLELFQPSVRNAAR